ncbi:hypothetical protein B0T22DRAFT_160998 [Podospora appendiculata]|uniref:FAD-binding PCMH-type domain-containing protein n=1 Tax=Podospora appendiculata TaxID=314037 RepID=A0AAE0XAE6_9PEZI|nr:hypothetical protein B0T22DRAFT_160998 [Podospora appendiculata]
MAAIAPKPHVSQAECLVQAGLRSQVLVPDDADYDARQDSYWSNSAKTLKPAAIVCPRTTAEVAAAVKALVAAAQPFAIRSGGHTNWAGSNNIDGGVTIDLSLLNATIYDAASETATIEPGARWKEVYAELHKHGRVVAGGREGNVGVAGLILGGGNTFFTARTGFACDNVVAYEVVLADGSIVTADATTNPDLFRALKGAGPGNFGIVTKFTMTAIPCDTVWGGMTFFPKHLIPSAIEAVVDFTDNVANDPNANLVCIFTHMPDFKDIVIATLYAHVAGVARAPAYEKWLALPEMMNTIKTTSVSEMAFEYNIPTHYHNTWFTLAFKNDARILAHASALHDALVAELQAFIPDGDFITQCLFQPLPTLYAANSVAAGGNVMGLERNKENGVLFLATVMVRTPEQEENVRRIREVAARYDPGQVFQKLCPGGFKVNSVKV